MGGSSRYQLSGWIPPQFLDRNRQAGTASEGPVDPESRRTPRRAGFRTTRVFRLGVRAMDRRRYVPSPEGLEVRTMLSTSTAGSPLAFLGGSSTTTQTLPITFQ